MSIAEKLTQIAENEQKVYDAGKDKAMASMWDCIQNGGARTNYDNAFNNKYWTNETFKPKHFMKPSTISYMFDHSGVTDGELIRKHVDFSDVKGAWMTFYYSAFETLPTLNFTSCGEIMYSFWGSTKLTRIELIMLSDSGLTTFHENTFYNTSKLSYIRFSGVIGQTINFKNSPLDKESIENIFSCLSQTASGKTVTFKKSAVNKAFETSEGTNDGATSQVWADLIATKNNWTISLV